MRYRLFVTIIFVYCLVKPLKPRHDVAKYTFDMCVATGLKASLSRYSGALSAESLVRRSAQAVDRNGRRIAGAGAGAGGCCRHYRWQIFVPCQRRKFGAGAGSGAGGDADAPYI